MTDHEVFQILSVETMDGLRGKHTFAGRYKPVQEGGGASFCRRRLACVHAKWARFNKKGKH
jgi:hypothetical protein